MQIFDAFLPLISKASSSCRVFDSWERRSLKMSPLLHSKDFLLYLGSSKFRDTPLQIWAT